MTIELYSVLISVGVLLLATAVIFTIILFQSSNNFSALVKTISYRWYLAAIAVISGGSIVGALIYEYVYLTPVCDLCWWQRIFMIPLFIVSVFAVLVEDKKASITTGFLAFVGLMISAYHYYHHFLVYVLGRDVTMGCSIAPGAISCAESPILVFGFITMPFMGMVAFLAMMVLALFAHISNK